MTDNPKTYSIVLRVQRVTYEDAYVAVPVTAAILIPNADGSMRIDPDAFVAAALRVSSQPGVEWQVESSQVAPHPIQQPKPGDRQCLESSPDEAAQ